MGHFFYRSHFHRHVSLIAAQYQDLPGRKMTFNPKVIQIGKVVSPLASKERQGYNGSDIVVLCLQGRLSVIVAASTSCIPGEPLVKVFDRLVDLEYTNTELFIGEKGTILPSQIAERHEAIVQLRRSSRRITPIAIFFDAEPDSPDYNEQFVHTCLLAKDCGIVVVTVHAAVPGTPFNEEIDRLRELVKVAVYYGVVVGIATEAGRITDTPETVGSLCKNVKGLGVTLDPSHYIYNLPKPKDYKSILPHVCHVRLRDTTQKLFQARIGQGIIEFGRLMEQLSIVEYRRALCVDVAPLPHTDKDAELRKMRLLLESLL